METGMPRQRTKNAAYAAVRLCVRAAKPVRAIERDAALLSRIVGLIT